MLAHPFFFLARAGEMSASKERQWDERHCLRRETWPSSGVGLSSIESYGVSPIALKFDLGVLSRISCEMGRF